MIDVKIAAGKSFWFENMDREPQQVESTMSDVMGDEDGWLRVVMKTKAAKSASNTTKPEAKASKASKVSERRVATSSKAGSSKLASARGNDGKLTVRPPLTPATSSEYEVYFMWYRGQCMATFGSTQCSLLLPWAHDLESAIRAFATLHSIKVGRGKNAIHCETLEGNVVSGQATMQEVMDANKEHLDTDGMGMLKVTIKSA